MTQFVAKGAGWALHAGPGSKVQYDSFGTLGP